MNTANWDIEAHSASAGHFSQLGAIGAVPPGQGVVVDGPIPYQAWAIEKRREHYANRLALDPEVKCFLPGVPRATYMPYPFQIVQGTDRILIAYEYAGASRVIRFGKTEPSEVKAWMGQSAGRWDGDTLVVRVDGFTGETWFDRAGNFHSDALTVTERYTQIDADHLRYEATIDDPKVFTRPWTISMPLYRRIEKNAQLLEYRCVEFAEELLYGHLKKPGS